MKKLMALSWPENSLQRMSSKGGQHLPLLGCEFILKVFSSAEVCFVVRLDFVSSKGEEQVEGSAVPAGGEPCGVPDQPCSSRLLLGSVCSQVSLCGLGKSYCR